jgi:hypothetical protein
MKLIPLLSIFGLLTFGAGPAAADAGSGDFAGTYIASLPTRGGSMSYPAPPSVYARPSRGRRSIATTGSPVRWIAATPPRAVSIPRSCARRRTPVRPACAASRQALAKTHPWYVPQVRHAIKAPGPAKAPSPSAAIACSPTAAQAVRFPLARPRSVVLNRAVAASHGRTFQILR